MKLFLKSTALFVCVALLFSACSKDETAAEKVLTKADPSEVTSITAGNGKFVVEWVVPEIPIKPVDPPIDPVIPTDPDADVDASVAMTKAKAPAGNSDIVYCVISWSGVVSGSETLYADGGETMTHTVTGLPAGDYTVSVQNYGDVELDSPAVTETVTIYGAETYANELPSVKNLFIAGSDVTMEWNAAHEDCSGVMVTYTNIYDREAKTSLLPVDKPFTISGVRGGTDFTFTSVFQPEGGIDPVLISDDVNSTGTFPAYRKASVPEVPTEVIVYPGDFKMKIDWTLTDSPARLLITYADGDDVTYQFVENPGQGENNLMIEELPVATNESGCYDVTVRAISADGNASETVVCEDVQVYDYVQYRLNCPVPTISEFTYLYNSYQLRLKWEENKNLEQIEITYVNKSDFLAGNNSETTTIAPALDEMLILDDIVPGSGYVCTAVYHPAKNSLDVLERTTAGTFPDAEVWKKEKDSSVDFAKYTYVWKEYKMNGDAENIENDGQAWSFSRIFDLGYEAEVQFKTRTNATAPMQTITIDLGRTYKLSKFAYKAYGTSNTTRLSGSNIKIMNVYGTNVKDPNKNTDYNGFSSVQYAHSNGANLIYKVPTLDNWTCLYYNATMTPDLMVNENGSYVFNISDEFDPVRYIKIQFVESFETDRTNDFYVGEIDFWHRGVFDWDNGYTGEYRAFDEWVNF